MKILFAAFPLIFATSLWGLVLLSLDTKRAAVWQRIFGSAAEDHHIQIQLCHTS